MFELRDEEVLMYSDDKSVKLTTNRIILYEEGFTDQIMLEDYESNEIRTGHIGHYKSLTIGFGIATAVLAYKSVEEYFAGMSDLFFSSFTSFFLVVSAILFTISIHYYLISRRYYVRINGKYGHFEFRIRNPRSKSLRKFLNTLEVQSSILKKQLHTES